MPTRYRPALAGRETTRQGEEMRWRGIGLMASVCTTTGRLTFRRFCWPFEPTALKRLLALLHPEAEAKHQTWRIHARLSSGVIAVSARSAKAPPNMHPHLPRLSSSLSGQTLLLLRTTTDLHVAINKRRCVLEQAPFFPSAVCQENQIIPPNHCIHTNRLSQPVSTIKHGLLVRPFQCPHIDTPVSPSQIEPLAVKVHKCQRD